ICRLPAARSGGKIPRGVGFRANAIAEAEDPIEFLERFARLQMLLGKIRKIRGNWRTRTASPFVAFAKILDPALGCQRFTHRPQRPAFGRADVRFSFRARDAPEG